VIPFMAWNLIPAPWRTGIIVGLLVVGLASVAGLYFTVRHQAYTDGFATAQAECERQKLEQAEANRKVILDAERRLATAAAALSLKSMELDDAIESISAAADADPDGTLVCLGADSLRRLNTIR